MPSLRTSPNLALPSVQSPHRSGRDAPPTRPPRSPWPCPKASQDLTYKPIESEHNRQKAVRAALAIMSRFRKSKHPTYTLMMKGYNRQHTTHALLATFLKSQEIRSTCKTRAKTTTITPLALPSPPSPSLPKPSTRRTCRSSKDATVSTPSRSPRRPRSLHQRRSLHRLRSLLRPCSPRQSHSSRHHARDSCSSS